MPRLGSGSLQSYIGNTKTSNETLPQHHEEAPNSANSLPRNRSLSMSNPSAAPSSMRSSASTGGFMMMNRPPNLLSPTTPLSPIRSRSTSEQLPMVMSDSAPRKPTRNILRASEGGVGTLLPDFSAPLSKPQNQSASVRRAPPDRVKTRSSPSLAKAMNIQRNSPTLPQTMQDVTPKQTVLQATKASLRRRTTSSASDDEDGYSYRSRDRDSPYRSRRGFRGRGSLFSLQKLSTMKLGSLLQMIIVLAITALVWESHHKALFAAQQLSEFKEEESLLLLHLQKIEQQSIQLHENLSRLAQSGVRSEPKTAGGGAGENVDFDLIHKQTQQLYQMEEELNHEVQTLQTRIQQSARNHIIQEFGEGPVQVVLDVDFGAGRNSHGEGNDRISILLWHDTPHAAWTWLEQIGRHVWDGSEFTWQQGHVIDALPRRDDPYGGKIEFVEQSKHGHEQWTVGLHESDTGALSMYVNLQDNSKVHKHETCVGKVIDGFDALQRVLEASRQNKEDKAASIPIRRATAMHVTKKEGTV